MWRAVWPCLKTLKTIPVILDMLNTDLKRTTERRMSLSTWSSDLFQTIFDDASGGTYVVALNSSVTPSEPKKWQWFYEIGQHFVVIDADLRLIFDGAQNEPLQLTRENLDRCVPSGSCTGFAEVRKLTRK